MPGIGGVAIEVIVGPVTPFATAVTPIAWVLERSAREWWRVKPKNGSWRQPVRNFVFEA
jgi:hypothetical protein